MSSYDEVVNILSLGKNPVSLTVMNLPTNLYCFCLTDGGGVRALSEVMMLDRIMKRIQEKQGLKEIPKPCDYFHLIGGSGTGG